MSDASTLSEIIDEYATGGFTGEFGAQDEARVRCHACGADHEPTQLSVSSRHRTEGASDPAEMSTVYALACPACGQRGTLVLRFGPEASADEAEIARRLPDTEGGDAEYTTPAERATAERGLDPEAPGTSLFTDGDAVEPNEPA